MNYAVVFIHALNGCEDVSVSLYPNEESAKEHIRETYEEMCRSDAEHGWFDFAAKIADDGRSAKIMRDFGGLKDITELKIRTVFSD